jgi:chromosome segregation protein
MQIKELIIKNFKSFDYAQIPFKDGLGVVVGPNGSGKSNIIDALLFVFGITSLKRLRVDKLSDLVNHNSKEKTARVRLVFEHGGQNVDIVREIDASGKSVFLLNEKRKALNEITSFLEELGLTADSYYTVQQGDVTRVINMSSEERRKIIEDISGLSLFDERKKEAQDNLDKVNKRLEKVSIALNERRPYIEQLSKEKEDAIKYKELDFNEQLFTYTLYRKQIEDAKNELELEEATIQKKLIDIDNLQKEKKEIYIKISDLEKKQEQLNIDLIAHSEKVQSTIGRELSESKANKEIVLNNLKLREENLESLKKENEKAAIDLSLFKKQSQDVLGVINDQKQKLDLKKITRDQLKEKVDNNLKEYEKLRALKEEYYLSLNNINKKLALLQDQYLENKNKISAYNYQKESLEKQEKIREQEKKDLEQKRKEIEDGLIVLRKDLEKTEKEILENNKDLDKIKKDLLEKTEKQNKFSIDLASLKKDLSFSVSVLDKKDKVKEKLKKFSSYVGFLEDHVSLDKSQKSIYSNYVILKDVSEISKIIKDIDINIYFVVLSALDLKLEDLFENFKKEKTKHTKQLEIDGFYFDGFCYKRILVKDSKDLETKIGNLEKEISTNKEQISKLEETIKEKTEKLNFLIKEQNTYNIKINTQVGLLDDLISKISDLKERKESVATKTITQNLGQTEKDLTLIEKELSLTKTQKQEIDSKLKEIDLGSHDSLRDEYDSLVFEINQLEQSLISKNAEIKSFSEKSDSKVNYIEINNQKIKEYELQVNEYKDKLLTLENKIKEVSEKYSREEEKKQQMFEERSKINHEISQYNQQNYSLESDINEINSLINDSKINLTTIKSKITQTEQNLKLLETSIDIKKENIDLSIEELYSKLRSIKREKNALGNINFNAIESYEKLAKEYEEIIQKYDVIIKEREQVEAMLSEINMKKTTIFMDCFNKVNKEFKDVISKMSKTLLGSLELVGEDELTSKLMINITKNKTTKNIDIMSGGEKTITALAFIFAINAYKKCPFYILDEVDAALDDLNSDNLLNYIKELSKSTTIIAVTHNSALVSGANQIVGVTLKGNSSVIGLDMGGY